MELLAERILMKARLEQKYANLYAKLCSFLSSQGPSPTDNFRLALIKLLQKSVENEDSIFPMKGPALFIPV